MVKIFRRSWRLYQNEGVASFFASSKDYILNRVEDRWLKYRYKLEYGDVAPRPDERLWVDPRALEYTIEHSHLREKSDGCPNYGVLGGAWDKHKNHWRDSVVWSGLRERFEDGKPWEETSYYQFTLDRLESNEYAGYLDGPQTKEHLERYTTYLDELYSDMKNNGYDPSSVITVHVGRNGEWIVGQGNHRRTLANIIGIESVPVRIRFRHEQWQDVRLQVARADSVDAIPDVQRFLGHPDVPDPNGE